MKTRLLLLLALGCGAGLRARADAPSLPEPTAILMSMERAADWQLANPSKHQPTDWTQAAGSTGMMALANISGNSKYLESQRAMGEAAQWQPGPRKFDADDHCIGQTYVELYLRYRENGMIAPLRARLDSVLDQPSQVKSLEFVKTAAGEATENWSWCDSLFMGPPTWIRLYAATGDPRYLDFAVKNWWRTSDYLYDRDEHLYFRDSTYFAKREANGAKIFWSRGNGWVMAGLARMLQFLPDTHPDRPRFEQQFRDMAARVLSCQQPDGLWRASLLDPASYPLRETSGSGFYVFALAWGINQGLLDRATYLPAVQAGWAALASCLDADGKLTHVQPIGADPKKFSADTTEVYGVGAFLLAGSEVYRMSVLGRVGPHPVHVIVHNPAAFRRENETVEIACPLQSPAVIDGACARLLDSQVMPAEDGFTLLFQADLEPGETRTFVVLPGSALAAIPPPLVKTFARQIHERYDDVAWESDRTAHRMYQLALIKAEGTISSGIDVWSKRTRALIVDEWYRNRDYHNDHGDGMDDYQVGRSRGCGGLGIWDGTKLHVSVNFRDARVITTGPIRSEFELTYDSWDAGGRKVSEMKRISVDAGSNMCRASSVFSSDDPSPLVVGIGIAQRPGDGGVLVQDKDGGWMSYWQPTDRDRGHIACGVIVPEGVLSFTNEKDSFPNPTEAQKAKAGIEGYPPISNQLSLASAKVGAPLVYYFGAGWSKSGDFPEERDWEAYVRSYAARLKAPFEVEVRSY